MLNAFHLLPVVAVVRSALLGLVVARRGQRRGAAVVQNDVMVRGDAVRHDVGAMAMKERDDQLALADASDVHAARLGVQAFAARGALVGREDGAKRVDGLAERALFAGEVDEPPRRGEETRPYRVLFSVG